MCTTQRLCEPLPRSRSGPLKARWWLPNKPLPGLKRRVRFERANLQFSVVTSPVDGYVVTRDLEEGATVVPGLSIFTIAESRVIWVSVNIDEREMDQLKVGQPATITLRSSPGRKIPGVVARIAKEADPVTEEVLVDVAFSQQPPDVKLNETAEVRILKSEKQAKMLPQTALVSGRDGSAVWTVSHGQVTTQSGPSRYPRQAGIRRGFERRL